jgi:hypothetical protein
VIGCSSEAATSEEPASAEMQEYASQSHLSSFFFSFTTRERHPAKVVTVDLDHSRLFGSGWPAAKASTDRVRKVCIVGFCHDAAHLSRRSR